MPKQLELNDDTLLESIAFTNANANADNNDGETKSTPVHTLDQCLLLAFWYFLILDGCVACLP